MSFVKNLQIKMNKITENYFANWTPEMPIAVGDYGNIAGYRFTKDGNLLQTNIKIEIDTDYADSATMEYKNAVIIKPSVSAKGQTIDAPVIPKGKAKVNIDFGDEGAFLYHLADISNVRFKNRQQAFKTIGQLILSGVQNWSDDYVLVQEMKQAKHGIVLVADGSNVSGRKRITSYLACVIITFNL